MGLVELSLTVRTVIVRQVPQGRGYTTLSLKASGSTTRGRFGGFGNGYCDFYTDVQKGAVWALTREEVLQFISTFRKDYPLYLTALWWAGYKKGYEYGRERYERRVSKGL